MLQRRRHAGALHAADVGRRQPSDHRRILTVGPRVDDRVARIVVHVHDRCKVHVDAERARLFTGDASGFFGKALITRRPERHQPRERRRTRDPEADAGFEVGGVQERHLRDRLQPVDDRRRFERLPQRDRSIRGIEQHGRHLLRTAEHMESPDLLLVNQLHQRLELGRVGAHEGRVRTRGRSSVPPSLPPSSSRASTGPISPRPCRGHGGPGRAVRTERLSARAVIARVRISIRLMLADWHRPHIITGCPPKSTAGTRPHRSGASS